MNSLTIFNGMKHSILLALTLQASLIADQVITTDGSVLIGQILGMQDGNLTIKTEFAGKLRIAHPQIAKISSEDSFSIRLEDNRTYNGIIVSRDDRTLGLEQLATNFELKEIRQLWPDGEDDPLILSAQKTAQGLLLQWKHALGFDLAGSSGNTDDFGLGIRIDSTLANKMREYDFYLSYNNSTKKNVTTVDETKFGAEYDSRFFEELAWYAKTDLENDRLEDIDLRATTALGLKYSWLDNQSYKVSVRAGAASRYEKMRSSTDDFSEPALDLGLEYKHRFRETLAWESDLTYVPSVSKFSDFLLSQDSALVIPLDKTMDWNLRSGVSGTYNSTPALEKEELDLKYYLRLVYRFD
jgi:putative salt-induced outer membrane protein YdiY